MWLFEKRRPSGQCTEVFTNFSSPSRPLIIEKSPAFKSPSLKKKKKKERIYLNLQQFSCIFFFAVIIHLDVASFSDIKHNLTGIYYSGAHELSALHWMRGCLLTSPCLHPSTHRAELVRSVALHCLPLSLLTPPPLLCARGWPSPHYWSAMGTHPHCEPQDCNRSNYFSPLVTVAASERVGAIIYGLKGQETRELTVTLVWKKKKKRPTDALFS